MSAEIGQLQTLEFWRCGKQIETRMPVNSKKWAVQMTGMVRLAASSSAQRKWTTTALSVASIRTRTLVSLALYKAYWSGRKMWTLKWRANRRDFCRMAAGLAVFVVASTPISAAAADFTTSERCGISAISGTIKPGDDERLKAFIKTRKVHEAGWEPAPTCTIELRLDGGDVDAAMAMGRLIRNGDPWGVHAIKCESACIFLFAAGVSRLVLSDGDGTPGEVGVHRVYYGNLDSRTTVKAIQEDYKKRLERVRAYFEEMNIARDFLDFMQSIPPEEMRVMSEEERHRYGFGVKDPVFDEHEMSLLAKQFGITSKEARRRDDRVGRECSQFEFSEFGICRDSIMEDIPVEQIRYREQKLTEARTAALVVCEGPPRDDWSNARDEAFLRCFKRQMNK